MVEPLTKPATVRAACRVRDQRVGPELVFRPVRAPVRVRVGLGGGERGIGYTAQDKHPLLPFAKGRAQRLEQDPFKAASAGELLLPLTTAKPAWTAVVMGIVAEPKGTQVLRFVE